MCSSDLEGWRRSDARERRAAFLEYESTSDALHAYDGGGGGTFFGFGECEVGVYVSVANGDVAEWHRDVCDNATIQLAGSKKWQVEEFVVTEEDAVDEFFTKLFVGVANAIDLDDVCADADDHPAS